jgi:DNA helicase HerA-like ATPase
MGANNMQSNMSHSEVSAARVDGSIGRIVSVTGAKAIVLLDCPKDERLRLSGRPEMGTLLAIETENTVVLAIVSALSVPVPAQRDSDAEIWIAELGLVGELWRDKDGQAVTFARGVTCYPMLGDRTRVASKAELEASFCGDPNRSVRIGSIRQDSSIPAMVCVDELLGKHFAILGTTGTGKSCTTALILRSILEKNPAAHIVLLDPHNEYATAFGDSAEVISPSNMHLPFWLLNFDEIVEVLIGDNERKAEIEILQELIPLAKARYAGGRGRMHRDIHEAGVFTVDTPVPYRISDLAGLLTERMGRLENKNDLAPYRQLKFHIDAISQDSRYAFMFGSLTVNDGMTEVLGRIFRVPVDDKPITILELTGLPMEIVNVVVSVLARMTFDFAHWSAGKLPLLLVCEEAHRYVPANQKLGFEPCRRAIARIAKEGRKYGVSLCIVTQRPAEIDPTIVSQCNTVFALRMSNDRDQEIVKSALSDTGSGLLEFLSALGQREALAFGDGVALPVRIKFDELPANARPRSSTANFSAHWQRSVGDEEFLEQLVEKWRSSAVSAHGHAAQEDAVVAEAKTVRSEPAPPTGVIATGAAAPVRTASTLRKDVPLTGTKSNAASIRRGTEQPTHMAAGNGSTDQPVPGEALKSLRERLMQRNQR